MKQPSLLGACSAAESLPLRPQSSGLMGLFRHSSSFLFICPEPSCRILRRWKLGHSYGKDIFLLYSSYWVHEILFPLNGVCVCVCKSQEQYKIGMCNLCLSLRQLISYNPGLLSFEQVGKKTRILFPFLKRMTLILIATVSQWHELWQNYGQE